MEKVDQPLISVFNQEAESAEMYQTMRDIVSLAGVFSALGNAKTFEAPLEILVFLRVIHFFHRESLGLDERIADSDTVYYRYLNTYRDMEPPTKKRIERYVNILVKYNWITKQSKRLKMRSTGKRMMDALIRAANDSLAYYMQDDIGRSLFQAKRDAEISEAYDDYGISGGHAIASMIRHVNDAIELLKERELELLADRDALPELERIHALMDELDVKMKGRLDRLSTVEDGLMMRDLIQSGTSVLAEGTSLSLGMIDKYLKFISMQSTDIGSSIAPEQVRQFIEKMFHPPVDSDIPNAHQILSFMEQDVYPDEAIDGMWVPIKMAPFLSGQAIEDGIDYLEHYEPYVDEEISEEEKVTYQSDTIDATDMEDVFSEAVWRMTKAVIGTEAIEGYLDKHDEAELEQLMVEATSPQFGDAIRSLMATSALVGNKKVEMKQSDVTKTYEKEWEWMKDGDRKHKVHQRKK